MEEENKKVNQGKNVYLGRKWKDVSQVALAELIGVNQNDISKIERQTEVEPKILQQISDILKIPFDFFTDFQLDEEISKYMNTVSFNDDSQQNINDSAQNIDTKGSLEIDKVINNPVDDVHKAYDKMIDYLKAENEQLKAEIKALREKPDNGNK